MFQGLACWLRRLSRLVVINPSLYEHVNTS
jgi:hypothetical protein